MQPTLRCLALNAAALALIFLIPNPTSALGLCSPDATTACFAGGDIQVTVDWIDGSGTTNAATLVPVNGLTTTSIFRFDDTEASEVAIRVLDQCGFNNRYWVSASSLSDLEHTITVQNLSNGQVRTYANPAGTVPSPILDSDALDCGAPLLPPALPTVSAGGDSELFLVNNRFRAVLIWFDFVGDIGFGLPTPILNRSGYFGVLNSDPQVHLKLVEGDNGFYRLVVGSLTNIEWELMITDLCTLDSGTYDQPLGSLTTVTDDQAFSIECAALIFTDSFEGGTTGAWSAVVGESQAP
ncbi:MAG: hypothetical protein AAGM22_17350 [Acidobacteriota bacterium]